MAVKSLGIVISSFFWSENESSTHKVQEQKILPVKNINNALSREVP